MKRYQKQSKTEKIMEKTLYLINKKKNMEVIALGSYVWAVTIYSGETLVPVHLLQVLCLGY